MAAPTHKSRKLYVPGVQEEITFQEVIEVERTMKLPFSAYFGGQDAKSTRGSLEKKSSKIGFDGQKKTGIHIRQRNDEEIYAEEEGE